MNFLRLRSFCGNRHAVHKDTRQRVVSPTPNIPSNAILYRGDGASRGKSSQHRNGARCGCIRYDSTGQVEAWMNASLPNYNTNNGPEYRSWLSILQCVKTTHPVLCAIQQDSLLVCRQIT